MPTLKSQCRVLEDTTVSDEDGYLSRTLTVLLGRDTVVAEVTADRVRRIQLWSPAFQTRDSLGVGTPFSAFKALPGVRSIAGEGSHFLLVPTHCGLSFQLQAIGDPDSIDAPLLKDQDALPGFSDSVRVEAVLVVRCGRS